MVRQWFRDGEMLNSNSVNQNSIAPFAPSSQVIPLDTGVPTQQRYPSSYSP
jgi:hypothetical protein